MTEPKFRYESFDAACSRVPAIERFKNERFEDSAAQVLELVDSVPGYELFQMFKSSLFGVAFVFKRVDHG